MVFERRSADFLAYSPPTAVPINIRFSVAWSLRWYHIKRPISSTLTVEEARHFELRRLRTDAHALSAPLPDCSKHNRGKDVPRLRLPRVRTERSTSLREAARVENSKPQKKLRECEIRTIQNGMSRETYRRHCPAFERRSSSFSVRRCSPSNRGRLAERHSASLQTRIPVLGRLFALRRNVLS